MTTNTITLATDDKTAAALIDTIKAATNGVNKYAAYVTAHSVTRANVKDHAFALAVFAYPNEKTVQTVKDENGTKTRTKFGNAVQCAATGLRSALDKAEGSPTDYLARLVKAAEAALDHEFTRAQILDALAPIVG